MRGRGLNACSVVIKKYRTVCCSVKTNKGRLVRRAAGGCGEGFEACESGRRCAGVYTRVSKNRGEFLLKQTPGGERVVGASGGDAVAAVGYREVVKREFARESPPLLGPRRVSEGLRPSVYIGPETDPSQKRSAFDISLQSRLSLFLRKAEIYV